MLSEPHPYPGKLIVVEGIDGSGKTNAVMGADRQRTRDLFGCALIPDLVLYLRIDADHVMPRVLEGKGMDDWESGMHLALGSDIFDSLVRYQSRLIREYDRLAREFSFTTVDARKPIDHIQGELRRHISAYLQRSQASVAGEPKAPPTALRR